MEVHPFKLRISVEDMKAAVEFWLRSHFINQAYTVREVKFEQGAQVKDRDEFEVLIDPPNTTPLEKLVDLPVTMSTLIRDAESK